MAIQPNRRKRKHETTVADQTDEAEVAVPKKVAKESHTPKTKKKTKEPKTNTGVVEEEVKAEEQETVDKENQETPTKKQKRKKEKQSEETSAVQDEEMDEAEISPDSGIEPEEKPTKFPNDFKMMNFRNKLLGNSFITGK